MSTPYYEDDLVTLWHGDCREVAAWLDADVLVTDPPYGIAGHLSAGYMGDVTFPWGRGYELIYVNGDGWSGPRESPVLRVIHSSRAVSDAGHPTPKPLGLMAAIIRKAPRGVVADPFSGSGSTLVAAKAEGRRAIGVELDERYCEIAARRLAQDTLFGEVTA